MEDEEALEEYLGFNPRPCGRGDSGAAKLLHGKALCKLIRDPRHGGDTIKAIRRVALW